jgi:hypothetical protein
LHGHGVFMVLQAGPYLDPSASCDEHGPGRKGQYQN